MGTKKLAALLFVLAVGGCANELPAPSGTRVTGQDLNELFGGATIWGGSYARKQGFVEHYHPDGSYEIAFSAAASSDDYGKTHRGKWRIEGDRVCYTVASLNDDGCVIIYRQYTQIDFVMPETGKAAFYSFEIKYEGKVKPAAAAADSPAPRPAAPLPSPSKVATVPAAKPQPKPTPAKPAGKLKQIGSGSGFIVNNETYVLTNNHVVEGCPVVTVLFDRWDVRATVRARDPRNDLAVLRLPRGKRRVAVFRGNDGLYPGDSVLAIGYPLVDILASEGTVSVGIVNALAGLGNDASLLQVSNPIQPGNSGGPLFDMSGHVVGVIVSRLSIGFALKTYGTLPENVNFAIKSSVATAFLQASGVEYRSGNSRKEMKAADVARKGKPATVSVWCWK